MEINEVSGAIVDAAVKVHSQLRPGLLESIYEIVLAHELRQRLRAILKKHAIRRGCATGRDFQRWPNAYFAEQGLYSLIAAHESVCQS